MAKEGARKKVVGTTNVFVVPPMFAIEYVREDILGAQCVRNINSCVNIHETFILEPDQNMAESVT